VIHLYEADWNIIINYFIAKNLLHTAINQKTTSAEQSGRRPGHSTIEEATKTIITYETCQLQHLSGGIVYNDAKACYDRIVENLSNITCICEGLPIEIAKLHAETFPRIKYFIKDKSGIATKPNGHSNQPDPFHGAGQGSGDAGARWGFGSSVKTNTTTPATTNNSAPYLLQFFISSPRYIKYGHTKVKFSMR
jgi:hypothetical protein